jgi:hypothetical protein
MISSTWLIISSFLFFLKRFLVKIQIKYEVFSVFQKEERSESTINVIFFSQVQEQIYKERFFPFYSFSYKIISGVFFRN